MTFWDSIKKTWKKGVPGSVYALEHPDPSIYRRIFECVVDDELPEDWQFFEPDKIGENVYKIYYADGAKDSLLANRFGIGQLSEDAKSSIGDAVQAASCGNAIEASSMFVGLTKEYRAVEIIDEIQSRIMENVSELDEQKLFEFAVYCIVESNERELPKVGLAITELYGEPEMKLKLVMRTLALCEEYTLFVVWNMRHWKFASTELLNIAKRTHGWGRIHAINEIDADSDEIRRWILFNGVDNRIGDFECAKACFVKSDAIGYLRSGMTYEEFVAVGKILVGLVAGPGSDVSEVEGWQDSIRLYMVDAKRHELALEDYERILYLCKHAGSRRFVDFEEACEGILRSQECARCVNAAIEKGKGVDLAAFLGMPYKETLLSLIESDFQNQYWNCSYVADEEHMPRLIEVFDKNIPLSAIESGPADETGFGPGCVQYRQLGCLLQNLRHMLPTGLDVVLKGLNSPVVSNRSMSVDVLSSWVEDELLPLELLSTDAYESLSRVYEVEPCEDLKNRMGELLCCMREEGQSSSPDSASSTGSRMRDVLEESIKSAMSKWDDEGIYAVSFWVTNWDDNPYEPIMVLGYNTERQVSDTAPNASSECEARWNFAFWLQNDELSFGGNLHKTPGDSPALVARWVRSIGFPFYTAQEIEIVPDEDIDEVMMEGERVTKAFCGVLVDIVQDLHASGFIRQTLGRDVPVIIHDLEYAEGISDYNIRANGDILPAEFVAFCNGQY